MGKKRWSIIAVLGILFFSSGSEAQGPKGGTLLPEVLVTETRIGEERKIITSSITVLDEEDIKNSTAQDVGDLLAEKGLGHIQKYPGALTAVSLRGFRTDTTGSDLQSHVLILLDGRRAGTGNLSKIPTAGIERIEIVNGPASVQYGSSAMGGVINVITKKGKAKPTLFSEGVLGSFGSDEVILGGSGKTGAFDFAGSVSRETQDDYSTGDGTRYYNTGFKNKKSTTLNVGYEFLPGNRVGVIYRYFKVDHQGESGYLIQNDLDNFTNRKSESLDLSYNGQSSNAKASWMLRYFDGKDQDLWADPVLSNPTGWDDGISDEQRTDQKGGQAQVSVNLSSTTLTAGLDWVKYDIITTWDPKESQYDNPAYFLLVKQRLFKERLILSGGLRYDDYKVRVGAGQGTDASTDNTSPRVGAAFHITNWLKLRANYGEAFMMPSAQQLAGNVATWGLLYKGNPSLRPEKSKTSEFGFDVTVKGLRAGATYFDTRVKDKIQQVATLTGFTWENLGSADLKGWEGNLSYDLGEPFKLPFEIRPYMNLVYLGTYKDKDKDVDLNYTPDWTLSYGITISNYQDFSTNLNFSYMGKEKVEDWVSGIWPAPVVEKNGFTLANLSITKGLLDLKGYGKLALRGEIKNLLDKQYEYVMGYPMPGRSFYLGLRYDL